MPGNRRKSTALAAAAAAAGEIDLAKTFPKPHHTDWNLTMAATVLVMAP